MILTIALALNFWSYNGFINELQYHVTYSTGADESASYVCGAVGHANDGMFYADIVRPRVEEKIESTEFNTIDGAEAFVEKQCR